MNSNNNRVLSLITSMRYIYVNVITIHIFYQNERWMGSVWFRSEVATNRLVSCLGHFVLLRTIHNLSKKTVHILCYEHSITVYFIIRTGKYNSKLLKSFWNRSPKFFLFTYDPCWHEYRPIADHKKCYILCSSDHLVSQSL